MKKMIGGQKLKALGSTRHTDDIDFLVYLPGEELFIKKPGVDLINAAAGNSFFKEIWEKENEEISLNSLFELKCYSFVQHCQNMNFGKADNDEFDIKFIARLAEFKLNCNIVKKYVTTGQLQEIITFINGMKK